MNKVKLGDITEYSNDRISSSKLTVENYVGTDNIRQNKTGKDNSQYVPTSGSTIAYKKGDILIANIRPYLKKIWFANNNGGSSADVSTIRVANDKYLSEFVYYNLFQDSFFDYAMQGAKGSKMPRIDKQQIMNFPIADINIKSQTDIAKILGNIDRKISINDHINAELEAMAKTLYDYWFVQFDFPDETGKPYKTSGGKMVWNEELKRDVPEGWGVGTLLDIASYINGLPCQKFRPKDCDMLRVIKIREMHGGFSTESEFVSVDVPQRAIIENGDILFSWSASLEVMIWTGGRGVLNQHIFKVTSKRYPKSFYYFQLVNYLQHFKMMAENRKTTMGHITQEHLQQSRVILPPEKLALDLERVIAPILQKKINNEIENKKLAELRDWLLPMLMNGQVKVTQ